MKLMAHVAERIARRMERDGFACSVADVWTVYKEGTLEGRESLASRILGEMGDYVDLLKELSGLFDGVGQHGA